jgi:ferric-dicitrate binding protein FerR (iron transport regulator)
MEENKNIEDAWVAWITGESDLKPESGITESEAFRELERTWELAGTAYAHQNSNPDKAWSRIGEAIIPETKVVKLKRFNYLRYAAVFVALFALGSVTFLLTRSQHTIGELLVANRPASKTMTIQTVSKPALVTTVLLPDGSSVKINAHSTLKYPEKFTGGKRRVELSGEAFFDVIHDEANPFVVEINNISVEDIGTSFNISAYPAKDKVEVNVTSGSVRLVANNGNESTVISAGSNAKFLKENGKILVSGQLTPNYLAWITQELTFRHTPLSTVFDELENIYHVRIEIADPKIANISYTANFEKFQIEDIVNIIAKTHHLSVTKQADGFVFASK